MVLTTQLSKKISQILILMQSNFKKMAKFQKKVFLEAKKIEFGIQEYKEIDKYCKKKN